MEVLICQQFDRPRQLLYCNIILKRDEIASLFRKYGSLVYRRARYLLSNHEEAEEAVQEVFLRALTHAEVFEHRSQVSTWLYRITTNYCLNRIRERRVRKELWARHGKDVDAPGGDRTSPEGLIALRDLLAQADETEAQAAIYVYVDGMRHHEAAKLLGVSRRSVGNLIERFRAWASHYLDGKKSG